MASHVEDDDFQEFFNRLFNGSLKLFFSMAMLMLSIMPIFYPLFVNAKYFDGYYQIPILIVASIFTIISGLMGVLYVSYKKTKAISITSLLSALVNIITNVVLIRYIGLFAASVSTLISYIVMTIYRYIDINKNYMKVKMDKDFVLKTFIVIVILIPIYYYNQFAFTIFGMVVAFLYSIDLNKNNIGLVKGFIHKKLKRSVK